jgi:NitT/TauT family transport system ATP-binding protein
MAVFYPEFAAEGKGGDKSKPMLKADRLNVTYASSRGPVKAVEDFTLDVRPGEFVSILGPSGCGKSTVLSVAAGLLGASSGCIEVAGIPVSSPRREVGVVFQQANLLPWKNVLDNVLLPVVAMRLPLADYRRRAEELLDFVGLTRFRQHYPHELSGGMQQRVGIARALIHDPKLLLMDEPFAALDAMTRERMAVELQRIWSGTDKTVLFITHSIPEAVLLSDRVVVMSPSPGRIIEEFVCDLPRPRNANTMAMPRFGEYCNYLRKLFDNFEVQS